ncbi:Hypothetical protein NocV09_00101160 [Nannochloropsis oceanica]
MGKLQLILASAVLLLASNPSSVQALGGRRSQLVDALSDPTARENLYFLNDMARDHFSESLTGIEDMIEAGPEDVTLEGVGMLGSGSLTSAAAAPDHKVESPLLFEWANRLLPETVGTSGSILDGWLSSLFGGKLKEEEGRTEKGRELFFASLTRPPA